MKATELRFSTLLAVLWGVSCRGAAEPAPPVRQAPAPPVVASQPQESRRTLPPDRAWIIFGADTVEAELARTDEEREKGMMGRSVVPEGTGMLFVFTDEEIRSFWMSNTHFDLDVGFLDANLRLFDVQRMEAETTEAHDSRGPAMFALEVRGGWFRDHGIRTGARAELVFGPR